MKSKETSKSLEDFTVNAINGKQIDAIKGGGQGSSIVEEDAEGF